MSAVGVVMAVVIGVDDNPAGLTWAWLAVGALVFAFAHGWRAPKPFVLLAAGALGTFLASAVLHNLFYAVGRYLEALPLVPSACELLHVVFFSIAVFLCPPAFAVGVGGALVTAARRQG